MLVFLKFEYQLREPHPSLVTLPGKMKKEFFLLSIKFHCDSYIVLTLLNMNMTTKLPCHHPVLREKGVN